ncbi:hypothetical protein IGI39_001452 [Enterococcus sp. AZ135]|uniref:LPXTG cell wall anchor domain-containing protein n=1 Tax=unclassified Enterococcus TaxID=2608891 RepID=UPI003F20A24F
MKYFVYEMLIVICVLGFVTPTQASETSLGGDSETAVVVTVKENQAVVPHPNEVIDINDISPNSRGHPSLLPQTNEVESSTVFLGLTIIACALMIILLKRKRKNNE